MDLTANRYEIDNFGETAAAIKSLFVNIKKIENYQSLYDATQIFKNIMLRYREISEDVDVDIEDDRDYQDVQRELLGKNLSTQTIHQISQITMKHDAYLEHVLSPSAVNYLVTLNDNGKIIMNYLSNFMMIENLIIE